MQRLHSVCGPHDSAGDPFPRWSARTLPPLAACAHWREDALIPGCKWRGYSDAKQVGFGLLYFIRRDGGRNRFAGPQKPPQSCYMPFDLCTNVGETNGGVNVLNFRRLLHRFRCPRDLQNGGCQIRKKKTVLQWRYDYSYGHTANESAIDS